MSKYRLSVSFDETNFFWIIIENGKIISRNPTKEDLMGTKLKSYNKTNICSVCIEENKNNGKELTDKSILYPGNARKFNINEKWLWFCGRHSGVHRQKCDPNSQHNIQKSLRGHRTGNLDPNCASAKGKKYQKLACMLYGWEDLNDKYDNYETPLDCYDSTTGFYHQVEGRHYKSKYGRWNFSGIEREWKKIFEDMVCFCISEDGKIVERIYVFPKKEIYDPMTEKGRKSISIYKNPMKYKNPSKGLWYEKYRITDEYELKKANEILISERRKRKIIVT